ncbi:MAG TPA: manganese efflux pump MntP family protein [Chitinispirillaceae bacterium]|nr:manganese efflux pump MntP family protein [Chitinispirillaceae bacterium]
MEFITILLIALGLAADAFSVCVASGAKIKKPTYRQYFRFSFHFGLFQFLMPVIGYYGGVAVEKFISSYDHWIALIILSIIGGKMLWETFKVDDKKKDACEFRDPSRGWSLVMLSIATSIDAAAIGFSLAALRVPVVTPAVIIGIVCAGCSAAGLTIGARIGSAVGVWAERFGGVVLIGIGLKILVEHLGVFNL